MLSVESVTLGYAGRPVLEGISASVRPGEVVILIGPNGAGKSTLIRAASGVLRPLAGRVLVDDQDVHTLRPNERAKRIAVVPQAASLPDSFTAHFTVLLGRTCHVGWMAKERPEDQAAATSAMRRTATETLASRRLGELSGGERQLVIVARALAQAPRYLLLDEPTAHLDLRHEASILRLMKDLARDGIGVLAALHDLNLAARSADRIVLLAGGRVMASGAPEDVLTEENLSEAYATPVRVFHDPVGGARTIFPAGLGQRQDRSSGAH